MSLRVICEERTNCIEKRSDTEVRSIVSRSAVMLRHEALYREVGHYLLPKKAKRRAFTTRSLRGAQTNRSIPNAKTKKATR